MTTLPIPLTSMDISADKPSLLASYGQIQQDGYFKKYFSPDGPKFIWCKRPGLTAWADTTNSSDVFDIYYHVRTNNIVAVLLSTGEVFKINATSSTCTNITGTAVMDGTSRPSFVDSPNGASIYIATGGKIGGYLFGGSGAYLSDADAPTAVIALASLNNSTIAQRAYSNRFDWSDAGAPTTWSGLYAAAESTPSYTREMFESNGYLYLFKDDRIEIYRDDGQTFVHETQGVFDVACREGGSVRLINGRFYLLDANFDFRRITGMTVETISNPEIASYVKTYTSPELILGHHLKWDGKDFYLCQFGGAASNVTLVYDIELSQWYRWGNWTGSAYERWPISGICTAQNTKWYAGDYNIGKVHEITGTQDLGVDIRTMLRTDFIDRETPNRFKRCNELLFVFKRADTATTAKTMTIRHREEGSQTWSAARTISIESASTTDLAVRVNRFGSYKRRMWEFVTPDATQATLMGIWETFE